MTILFAPLIKKNEIITYIDDILIQAENVEQMFIRLDNFHKALRQSKLKAAPDKTFFFLLSVKFLGHVITDNKIKPLLNKIEAIQKMKRPESKKDVMKFLGALNYYSKYFPNMHVILAPLYKLLHNNVSFHWNSEHEDVFQEVKNTLTKNCELTLPNTKNPFFIMVDASAAGMGTVLAQADNNGQMQIISYNSRLFTESEQKIAIIYRELSAIVYALEIYEFIIIGSKHPITIFTDHKPILSLFARKGKDQRLIFPISNYFH